MRNKFSEHYRPSEEWFASHWETGAIVLDANILLDLYRYSPTSRDEILDVLEQYKKQLWLPYQAAEEYHRNRSSVILGECKPYQDLKAKLEAITSALATQKKHPFVSDETAEAFGEAAKKLCTELEAGKRQHESLMTVDPIGERIADLFDNRVGDPFSEDELKQHFAAGKARYTTKTPPGYMDAKEKSGGREFGDLILWLQTISHGKANQCGVVLVTSDAKEDWWLIEGGRTIGPRPELIREFRNETGQDFYLYTLDSFIRYAKETGSTVSDETVEEVREDAAAKVATSPVDLKREADAAHRESTRTPMTAAVAHRTLMNAVGRVFDEAVFLPHRKSQELLRDAVAKELTQRLAAISAVKDFAGRESDGTSAPVAPPLIDDNILPEFERG